MSSMYNTTVAGRNLAFSRRCIYIYETYIHSSFPVELATILYYCLWPQNPIHHGDALKKHVPRGQEGTGSEPFHGIYLWGGGKHLPCGIADIKSWIAPYQRTLFSNLLELLDTQGPRGPWNVGPVGDFFDRWSLSFFLAGLWGSYFWGALTVSFFREFSGSGGVLLSKGIWPWET